MPFTLRSFSQIREALLTRREIALLDVREEALHAEAHPLFAANFPLARLELSVWKHIPRRDTDIVVLDNGEGLAERAIQRLRALGYTNVSLLDGGLSGWTAAGGELFRDVNVPSKAFGELVESQRHTPSLSASEVKALLDAEEDVVVLDARRFDEYHNMNIPGSISVPGAELVLRVRALAKKPQTHVIVNCAGRTRSIIGTQSLVNAGIPNQVHALRNGTIGWTLAGQELEHGQQRHFPREIDAQSQIQAAQDAQRVAQRAGVKQLDWNDLQALQTETGRTTYLFDVRTSEEYIAAHIPDFVSVPGGQLIQETEVNAPVRGARIVLVDDDGVRAYMTASWLAQMAWDVYVLTNVRPAQWSGKGEGKQIFPPAPLAQTVRAPILADWLADTSVKTVVLDFAPSANYIKQHIPGAWFVLRSQLEAALKIAPPAQRYVLTCGSSLLARYVIGDISALTKIPVFLLEGGNQAWYEAGLPLESGETALASPRIDRYRRPYEGTDNPTSAMQAYLDWEFGLVKQLERDGTHGFFVI